jgi:hypothetical protein
MSARRYRWSRGWRLIDTAILDLSNWWRGIDKGACEATVRSGDLYLDWEGDVRRLPAGHPRHDARFYRPSFMVDTFLTSPIVTVSSMKDWQQQVTGGCENVRRHRIRLVTSRPMWLSGQWATRSPGLGAAGIGRIRHWYLTCLIDLPRSALLGILGKSAQSSDATGCVGGRRCIYELSWDHNQLTRCQSCESTLETRSTGLAYDGWRA